jgi:predicted nuclease with TOPRIM domain
MVVMAREKWTDDRLDDLNARMGKGFDEVKGEIRDLRAETKTEFRQLRGELNTRFNGVESRFNGVESRFNGVESRFDTMEGRFSGIESRFDSLQKTMVLGFVSMTASIVGALLVTQL